jgi:hypothetical protein
METAAILWLFVAAFGASALGGVLGMASGIFIVPILTVVEQMAEQKAAWREIKAEENGTQSPIFQSAGRGNTGFAADPAAKTGLDMRKPQGRRPRRAGSQRVGTVFPPLAPSIRWRGRRFGTIVRQVAQP